MANFNRSSLFRRYDESQRRMVRQQWRQTEAYRAIRQVEEAVRNPGRSVAREVGMEDLLRRFSRQGFTSGFFRGIAQRPFRELVGEVVRYQASGGEGARLVGELLGALGPMGSLLSALIGGRKSRPSGIDGDVERAIQLLQAFAPDMLSPQARRVKTGDLASSLDAAIAQVEAEGYEVRRREVGAKADRPEGVQFDDPVTAQEKTFYPGGVPKTTKSGAPRKVVELPTPTGERRFPVDHPIVTGEMVTSFQSSNVHGFSYDYDASALYVRYQDHRSGGPGPMYAYANVMPDKFLSMLNAPSKGVWLWDEVRIRGTVSGHKHDYRLVSVRNDYVPRKATLGPGGEFLTEREMQVRDRRTGRLRWLQSKPGTPLRGTARRDSRG